MNKMPTWEFLWARVFTRIYFPGNLIWKVWRGKSTSEVKVLSRDGMSRNSLYIKYSLMFIDKNAQQTSSPVGIEYVEIK